MNQKVISNNIEAVDEIATWLDSLIGDFSAGAEYEIVTGIVCFQIVFVKGDPFMDIPDSFTVIVAVTTEITDAPSKSNFYDDDDPDKPLY